MLRLPFNGMTNYLVEFNRPGFLPVLVPESP
jgi:hypothetical protein